MLKQVKSEYIFLLATKKVNLSNMKVQLQNNQIRIILDHYDHSIIKFIRMLDGRQYVPSEKAWYIPIFNISEITLKNFQKLGIEVKSEIFEALQSSRLRDLDLERLQGQPDAPLDTSLPLYPFQRSASAWMIASNGGINAYPVGTGKTLMMLAALESLACQKIMVIAPKSLLYQWQSEIQRWQPSWNIVVIDGNKSTRNDLYWKYRTATTPAILIVSYDLARIDFNTLKDMPEWDAIVCDEAHRLGTMYTKTRKAIKLYEAKRRYALTATPLMNHPAELFGIIDWCFPGALGSYKSFLERYTMRNQWGGIMRAINTDELARVVRRYMIRKELSELAVELPPMTIEDIPFDLSPKERALYDQIVQELLFDIEKAQISKIESPVMIQMTLVKGIRLLELCDSMELLGTDSTSTKLEVLRERLADVAVNGNKVIIFSRFTRMVAILERELAAYKPCVITGQVTGHDRDLAVQAFRSDDSRKIMLCSEAGGEGLNLEMANIIFHYDLPYSYGKYVQRNGRIARMTQTKPMMVYNLVARHSMDEKVARIIAKKQDLSEVLLDGSHLQDLLR